MTDHANESSVTPVDVLVILVEASTSVYTDSNRYLLVQTSICCFRHVNEGHRHLHESHRPTAHVLSRGVNNFVYV